MTKQIRQKLNSLADEKLRIYIHRTTPTVPIEKIIGVKVPDLRKMAREIIKSDWRTFLAEAADDFIEELMLCGFVTATAKMSDEERFRRIKDFVPKIDNWMVCDTFCNTLKPNQNNKKAYWDFIQPYFYSDKTYYVRFGVVMLLSHFAQIEYADNAFAIFNTIKHDDYYVKMAVSWAISVCFVHFPEKTMEFLIDNSLDDFTFNKALQKITESYRVDSEVKNEIKKMKRK